MVAAVNRDLEAGILLVVGILVGRLTLDGGYLAYVKPGLYWPLMAACILLVGVGGASLWKAWRGERNPPPAHDHDHGFDLSDPEDHGHGHGGVKVGLLLLAPIMVLVLVAPAPLGAFAADRATANQFSDGSSDFRYPALPEPDGGAVSLRLGEVVGRSFTDAGRETLADVPLRLVGFVVPEGDATDRYLLTRFTVGCCAADAQPLQVLVTGVSEVPPADTWLEVTGFASGELAERNLAKLPVIEVRDQQQIEEPEQPYEY